MKKTLLLIIFIFISCSNNQKINGLEEEVEVLRDKYGINHIYANNEKDLFFMQGYLAAKDRLFQFEIWRRQATGTVSEIFGEQEFERDLGTRLFKFRGDIEEELNHYHENGYEIITSYTDGVNAYIKEVKENNLELPLEFKLLGIEPMEWTPEVVISRHQGLLGNIEDELNIGRAVSIIGEKKVKDLMWFHPKEPSIKLDPRITREDLENDILKLYNAYREPIDFKSNYTKKEYFNIVDKAKDYIIKGDIFQVVPSQRLKTDYIDLYQLHWPERKTNYFGKLGYEHTNNNEWNNFEEILNSLDEIIKSGKIKYIGLSNETAWGLSKFLEISKIKKLPRIMSVQNPYSLLNRTYEVGLAEVSIREKSGLLAYSPLAFGFLTGKYRNGNVPKNSRLDLFPNMARYTNDNCKSATELYHQIAKRHNLTLTELALAFVNDRPFVTSNIIGATNMEQLKENINSINTKLSKEILAEINQAQEKIPNPAP